MRSPARRDWLLSPGQEPIERLARDRGGYGVRAVELIVVHIVAALAEQRDDLPAAFIDRQGGIGGAVRDVNTRLALPLLRHEDARREGDEMGEEIAVREAERERFRRAV